MSSYMFSKCTSLISLDLSNFRTPSLFFAPGMFKGWKNLKYFQF